MSKVRSGSGGRNAGGTSYLDAIMPDVRRRLAERKALRSQSELEESLGFGPEPRPSFAAALRGPHVSLIAEVKRFSPSKGAIRPEADVASLVAAYERGGATSVSVLTEGDHFGGSLADLRSAAAATGLPLLRKDFVVDPYQLYEARACGASAVLLIAAILDDARLARLSAVAAGLGLDVLLEVHDAREMERAMAVEGAVIGINNRDLRTFEVSLEASATLAGMAPVDRLLVAESGIRDLADIGRIASAGIDAVLVGESLLRAEDVEATVRALTRPVCVKPRWIREILRGEEPR
jgi:indole-3-glycerol phosphate synthase